MAKYISIDKLKVMASYSKLAEKGMCEELQEIIANAEKCAEDVIERAKIDKAIQDIKFEKHYLRHKNIELDKMFDKGLDKALEILKRDIGG